MTMRSEGPTAELNEGHPHRLSIPSSDGVLFVAFPEIIQLRAEGSYTEVYCADGSVLVVCLHLGAIEVRLPSNLFFRCHHAHVVNLSKVTQLVRNGGYHVILSTGDKVKVSRRKWAGLVTTMERF